MSVHCPLMFRLSHSRSAHLIDIMRRSRVMSFDNSSENEEFWEQACRQDSEKKKSKWGFDFVHGQPTDKGQWEWEPVGRHASTSSSVGAKAAAATEHTQRALSSSSSMTQHPEPSPSTPVLPMPTTTSQNESTKSKQKQQQLPSSMEQPLSSMASCVASETFSSSTTSASLLGISRSTKAKPSSSSSLLAASRPPHQPMTSRQSKLTSLMPVTCKARAIKRAAEPSSSSMSSYAPCTSSTISSGSICSPKKRRRSATTCPAGPA
ncbi:hypothetical protein BLOT_010542 [Blomia tropicalis]|nr:hypothetical protein BLOT_010542 [Blomia tropicalis]